MVISFKERIGGSKISRLINKLKEKYNLSDEEIYEIIADSILMQDEEGYIDYKKLYSDAFERVIFLIQKSKYKVIQFPKYIPFRISQDEIYERIIKRSFRKLYDKEQGIILEHIIKDEDEYFDVDEYNYVIQKLCSIIEEEDSELAKFVSKRLSSAEKVKKHR